MIPINYEDETIETQTSGVPWGLIGGAVVIIGGAGGAYAYALNQNKKRKAAAARAAASRRAATAAGTTAAGAAGAASPYARRAAAAPIAPGTKQKDSANPQNKPTGGAPYGGVKNPYSSGSITGTQNPYSRPTAGSGTSATTAGSQGLHGGAPTGTAQNPYARSAQAGTGTGAAAMTARPRTPMPPPARRALPHPLSRLRRRPPVQDPAQRSPTRQARPPGFPMRTERCPQRADSRVPQTHPPQAGPPRLPPAAAP